MIKMKLIDKQPSLNELISKINHNRHTGNKFKKDTEYSIGWQLKSQHSGSFERIGIIFIWKEPDNRRDDDNVASAHKYILDSMQSLGMISGDGKKQIAGIEDVFLLDKKSPGVELHIYEYPKVKNEKDRLNQRLDLAKKSVEVYESLINV